jgi:hypothetical protein
MKFTCHAAKGPPQEFNMSNDVSAVMAGAIVAERLGYRWWHMPWRLGISVDPHKDHLDINLLAAGESLSDLTDENVFLTVVPDGVTRWN